MLSPGNSSPLSPKSPDRWKRVTSEVTFQEGGWHATYRCTRNGFTADLDLHSDADTDTVEVVLDDYTEYGNPETRTRRYERTVPELEDETVLGEIATEWVEKAENGEF